MSVIKNLIHLNTLFCFIITNCFFLPLEIAQACTSVKLSSSSEFLSSTNVDFYTSLKRALFVNKRGVWKEASPLGTTGIQNRWFAKWGSVTNSIYGREFAMGGINETGLVVHMQQDFNVFPELDPLKPKLHIRQSVQYLLDTSSSIAEAVKNLNKVTLHKGAMSIHWWICEASGSCAVLEMKNQKLYVYKGNELPISALTNTAYDQSLKIYEKCLNDGCEKDLSNIPNDSDGRFIKAAHLTSQPTSADLVQNALFHILPMTAQLENPEFGTLYSIGYRQSFEEEKKQIIINPKSGAKSQWLNMDEIDFSCKTPAQFQVISADSGEGNILQRFSNYNKNFQKEMTASMVSVGLITHALAKEMNDYPDTILVCE